MSAIDDRIAQKIEGRSRVIDLVHLAEVADMNSAMREGFFDALRKLYPDELAKPTPKQPEQEPISDLQAQAFGRGAMPFGKYQGFRVDAVPLEYLTWLADSPDEFRAELRRYLKSRRVQAEQDSE